MKNYRGEGHRKKDCFVVPPRNDEVFHPMTEITPKIKKSFISEGLSSLYSLT